MLGFFVQSGSLTKDRLSGQSGSQTARFGKARFADSGGFRFLWPTNTSLPYE
jgi:hypothetical protein